MRSFPSLHNYNILRTPSVRVYPRLARCGSSGSWGSSSWGSSAWLGRESSLAHDVSRDHGNTNHEQPAGNNTEYPEDVAERDRKTVLVELSLEWVEVALIYWLLLP